MQSWQDVLTNRKDNPEIAARPSVVTSCRLIISEDSWGFVSNESTTESQALLLERLNEEYDSSPAPLRKACE